MNKILSKWQITEKRLKIQLPKGCFSLFSQTWTICAISNSDVNKWFDLNYNVNKIDINIKKIWIPKFVTFTVILRELAKGIRKWEIERREGGSNFKKYFNNKSSRTVFFSQLNILWHYRFFVFFFVTSCFCIY